MQVRARFAPSPTGYLHVGGARTALYNWLWARKMGGAYILRIEDTDLERSTETSVEAILDSLAWLGLKQDEGPFYQTDHMDRYKQEIGRLLKEDKAYRCTCSKERLELLREQQTANKEKPKYDGHCLIHPVDPSLPYVVRFRQPQEGVVLVSDLVHGEVSFANNELDDFIIARTDGSPTYNFTVVVDDIDMKVTHVIRGDDHLNNTPRQINLYHALGAPLPAFAHIPMILGDDGKRLSKRHGAVSVMQYRDDGFLAPALLNYLVRLGWSHGDQEIFSLEEMITHFDLKDINKSAGAFNTEKLLWLNQHYMKTLPVSEVAAALKPLLTERVKAQSLSLSQEAPLLEELVIAFNERCKTLVEIIEKAAFCLFDDIHHDEAAWIKHMTPEVKPALTLMLEKCKGLSDWGLPNLHAAIQATAEQLGVGLGKVAQPARIAVTGSTNSPSLDMTLKLVGRNRVIGRLEQALDTLSKRSLGSL